MINMVCIVFMIFIRFKEFIFFLEIKVKILYIKYELVCIFKVILKFLY